MAKEKSAKTEFATQTRTISLDLYIGKVMEQEKEESDRVYRISKAVDMLIAENGGADKFICTSDIKGQKYFTFKV